MQPGLLKDPQLSIAAINGPESVVLSGAEGAVVAMTARLEAEKVECKRLTVSHAFHSALMDPMLAEFAAVASTIQFAKPRLPLISNVTGALATDEVTTPDYWVRHVRETVRFADGMQVAHRRGCLPCAVVRTSGAPSCRASPNSTSGETR